MTEEERNKKLKREIKRIKLIFKQLTYAEMKRAEFLINRTAFMKITLEEMEGMINLNGIVEDFTQDGLHHYERERPVSKIYNVMIKNYNSTIKQLFDMLPEKKSKEIEDELTIFLNKS